jgi:hypothetical protein
VADRVLTRFYPGTVPASVRAALLKQAREKSVPFQSDEGVRLLVQFALSHPEYQLC